MIIASSVPVVAQEPTPPAAETTEAAPASSEPAGVTPPSPPPPAAEMPAPVSPASETAASPAPSAAPDAVTTTPSEAVTAAPPASNAAPPPAEPGLSPTMPPEQQDTQAPQASEEMPVTEDAQKTVDASHLPRDLSPWNMFLSADIIVKAVMIGLALASVVTWTVWLAKSLELTWAKRRLSRAFASIHASSSLAEAAQRLSGRKGIVASLIELAAVELHLSADVPDKGGIKERVASRLDGLASAAGRDMNRGTGVLATIGSTSPFVGLFGTVWGIMNSFIGISEAQTTNLAVVAPGIAEALLATALGLVAAIPAVIIYNQFARQIGGYRAMIAEASAEVQRLVSRDLDRGLRVVPAARAAE